MRRELHVRFCEGGGVRFPSATRRNIYVRSQRAGERVMESITRFLTTKLKLKVNQAKSAVAQPKDRKFLGFSFTGGQGTATAHCAQSHLALQGAYPRADVPDTRSQHRAESERT